MCVLQYLWHRKIPAERDKTSKPKGRREPQSGNPLLKVKCAPPFLSEREKNCTATPNQIYFSQSNRTSADVYPKTVCTINIGN